MAAWSTIWSFTLFVWTRPQWDARRVEVRRRRTVNGAGCGGFRLDSPSSHSKGVAHGNRGSPEHTRGSAAEGSTGSDPAKPASQHRSRHLVGAGKTGNGTISSAPLRERSPQPKPPAAGHDVDKSNGHSCTQLANGAHTGRGQEFEYYWQDYPADDGFLTRLSWAFDIVSTFRMTGK